VSLLLSTREENGDTTEKYRKAFKSFFSSQEEMGEVGAKRDMVTRHNLKHDRHTVSLLTDHLVFSPKYRGKCCLARWQRQRKRLSETFLKKALPKKQGKRYGKELDIEVTDMAMGVDHIHLFIKYPPKYSVSWIAKRLKGRSSKLLRDRFPELKDLCLGYLWAPSCYHESVINNRLVR